MCKWDFGSQRICRDFFFFFSVLSAFSFSWIPLPSRPGQHNTPTASPQRGKTTPNECPGYDTIQSDGEFPVILELWGMRSTPLLPSLPGPL